MPMEVKNTTSLKTVTLLLALLLVSSCSKDDSANSNGNWETYSTNKKERNEGIDYARPEDSTASTDNIETDSRKGNTATKLNLTSAVENKMFREYGAIFFAKNGVVSPSKVVFNNETEVSDWQSKIPKRKETINGISIELQKSAMDSLLQAIDDAKQKSLSITPRGTDAAKRNYSGTVSLWKSRVNPGLNHWVKKGRLPKTEAEAIRVLPISEQISEIFRLERQGMYFSTGKNKSIIYSVAPPGTSQHISMLALDVSEHGTEQVRQLLAKHGWFQTVISDTPHFTYLGVKQEQLPQIGLKRVNNGGRSYWIPDM